MCKREQIRITKEQKNGLAVAALSEIGDRTEQQDAFGFLFKNDVSLIVVCDGMGGHDGGHIASSIAVNGFIEDCSVGFTDAICDYRKVLISCVQKNDKVISSLIDRTGSRLNAGSTVVALVFADKQLFWCSCGDSRAYLLRNREFVQFTKDQNYKTVLQEQLHAGVISQEMYLERIVEGDALVSYLGIGNISLIDYNELPLQLSSGDRIIITTDGLYKLLADADIKRVLSNHSAVEDAVKELWLSALSEAKLLSAAMDNTTIVVVDIC